MSTISSHGYVLIYVGKKHPMADVRGYAYEHRLIAAKNAGRMLLPGEIAHHDDENKKNNGDLNIILESSIAAHKVHHRKIDSRLRLPDEKNFTFLCCCGCGEIINRYDKYGRPKYYKHRHFRRTGRIHNTEIIKCSCGCGLELKKFDKYHRERKFISGHNARKVVTHES